MADPINIRGLVHLPPDDTRRAFDARGELRTTVKWHEMLEGEHARAFTVAKVANLDLLETIRTSLADAVANGATFEQWKERIIPDLQRAGWWGRVQDRELTGTDAPVFIGPRRLETIFRTNMRVSRAAGQWARIQDRKDVAPYLRYSAVMDDRTRPLHRLWHGTILPVDHEWWDTHFPPCGWNCRCTVVQLSERDLRANGWSVSQPPAEGTPSRFWRAGSDQPQEVPAGIDPGWAYNPGRASMRAIADRAAASIERAAVHDIAIAREALSDLVASPAFLHAMEEPGTRFPVMVLDDTVRAQISANAHVATLSAETFAEQRRSRPELTAADYRLLPDLGAAPDLIFRQDDQRLIFTRTAEGRWMKAAVQVTEGEGEGALNVVSFEYARASEIQRLRRRFPLVFGQIAGALAAIIAAGADAEEEETA